MLSMVLLSACSCSDGESTKGGFVTSDNFSSADDAQSVVTVDTIRYNVSLIPQEDYEEENLQYLNKKQLVDAIFNSVYSGKTKAYTYYNNKPISATELQQTEIEDPHFRRNLVSVLQFTEAWQYNSENATFRKRVISVHVAYAIYRNGEFAGNRGGFVVMMND